MLTSIDVKFIFNCLFIDKFRRKRVGCSVLQIICNLVPRYSRLTVHFSGNYAAQLMSFFTYRKIRPNLVDSNWL